MDKKQAQMLIKETFESPFDKNRFVGFVKNLLNKVEDAPFIYRGNFIPDAYEQYVASYERIGKYRDGDNRIDILIVKLNRETSIERARTMQRNFVAGYLQGKYGSTAEKEGALVAFVAPNDEDWRFSLVKMDYRFEEGKKGRMRVKEEFTPARRWSFLVGVNENSHTAQSQLVDLVADDERNPAIAQLEESFNIEKVTKEFFEKYRELFLWTKETLDDFVKKDKKIREDFETKGVNTVDFTKKLLGQIVFLYFLQKKGWFGVKRDADWGTGPKNFLRELFEGKHGTYKNLFNDILEPLFYEALRIDRSHDDDYYSKLNCRIPFLNGGLFDPINNYDWVHTDILLPNDLFSNNYKTKEGDKGNGILDIFDRYNFTVKEDEPLEKEVAVDPEMLGKVFENLLEVRDRKSKGTYYTPREIVHYMCQQSLVNYLATELEGKVSKEDIETLVKHGEHLGENETTVEAKGRETSTYFYKLPEGIRQNAELIDKELIDIKVCDPAIGSGAFPVGMMGEIVKTRNVLSSYIKGKDRTIYNFKRECIEKSLYGVDIDSGAVEIAKLRLWLSLVVDEEDIKQIKPLPNLDYKIVCGNSLLGVEKDLFNSHLFSELERLKPLLFNEINPSKKQQCKKQIDDLIRQITHGHKEFDFEVYFSEIFHENKKGFDVVIANPPYGTDIDAHTRERFKVARKEYHPEISRSCYNSEGIFIEQGINLLKHSGTLTYIIPNNIARGSSFEKIRTFLLEETIVKIIVDEGNPFESVTLEMLTIIIQKKNHDIVDKINILSRREGFGDFHNIVPQKIFHKYRRLILYYDELFKKIIKDSLMDIVATSGNLVIGSKHLTKEKGQNLIPVITGRSAYRYAIRQDGLEYAKKSKLDERHIEILEKELLATTLHINEFRVILKPVGYTLGESSVYLIFDEKLFKPSFIMAILNSRLINFYVRRYLFNNSSLTFDLTSPHTRFVPIKNLSFDKQKPFVDLADKILTITKDENNLTNLAKQAKVREYERQIDQMVYKLYDLTENEIKIVEDFDKK